MYGINYALVPSRSIGAWGFVLVVAPMALASGGLYVWFHRRGWL